MNARVTAHLLNGLVHLRGEVLSIDGPLLYAVTLERLGPEMFGPAPAKDEVARATSQPDPDLPLDVHRVGECWIYAASDGVVRDSQGTTITHWNKRIDDGMLVSAIQSGGVTMGGSAKVQINSGQYKSYHVPIWTDHADRVEWHVSTPDPDRMMQLLQDHIHHIGRHRNTGSGVVSRWEIEEVEDAGLWLWREDGAPARPIPLAMLPQWDGPVEHSPVRPPYWLIQHHEDCARVRLPDTEEAERVRAALRTPGGEASSSAPRRSVTTCTAQIPNP